MSTRYKRLYVTKKEHIILASKSASRASILKTAGIPFRAVAADVDEAVLKKHGLERGQTPAKIALTLAQAKAKAVSDQHPGDYVLGGDQILVCQSKMFDKPTDMAAAKETLVKLRGQTHTLICAAAIYKDGKQVFEVVEEAHLTMQDFSDTFLQDYLKAAGDKILTSVGAYQLEAEGAKLFTNIDGDFFTVLGLPLKAVADFCQTCGILKGKK